MSSTNVLAAQLSIVVILILAGAVLEVYSVEMRVFDTHASQLETQSCLLRELGSAVTVFVDVIQNSPNGRKTFVLIGTEFGRRVSANSSAGTDHDWANNVFVAGPPVKGGFYGERSSFTKLQQGNLIYTRDFGTVYAAMLCRVLAIDPKPFSQGSFSTIPRV